MVNWSNLQQATSPDKRPTPGWLLHELCADVRRCPKDVPDVAEYLMQCVLSDRLNVQLKAVLVLKHLSSEAASFQQFMQGCQEALRILRDMAAPPLMAQSRAIETVDLRTLREATESCILSIDTPHTLARQTEAANLRKKILGFGNYEPPAPEQGLAEDVTNIVADSVGDVVSDFREKGAIGALKDATIDALDLVLDGVDAVVGLAVGKGDEQRICTSASPTLQLPNGQKIQMARAGAPVRAVPGFSKESSADHYAVAFGGVAGANNPLPHLAEGDDDPPPQTEGAERGPWLGDRPTVSLPDLLDLSAPAVPVAQAAPADMLD